jgi:hypothetical protein
MMIHRKSKVCLFGTMLVATLVGVCCCQRADAEWKVPNAINPRKHWPFKKSDEPQLGTPIRVVGTWVDTTMSKPGEKPQRGFGGRLTFYEENEDKPILVEGQLVVYAFDEIGRAPTDTRPTRRYVFPAEQMSLHMSKSKIGASYSFWLPWDEVGGRQTEVSLISRFEPKEGAVICSEQTRHLLPGLIAPEGALTKQDPPKLPEGIPSRPPRADVLRELADEANAVRLASYESATAAPIEAPPHMTTTSIALPENFRVRGNAPNVRAGALPAELPKRPTMPVMQHSAPQQMVPPSSPTRSTSMTDYNPAIRAGLVPIATAQQVPTGGLGWSVPNQQQSATPQPMVRPIGPTQIGPTQIAPIVGSAQAAVPQPQAPRQSLQEQVLQQMQQQQAAPQAPDPNSLTTTVSYLSPADSIRWELGQRSSGSAPPAPPAQSR